MPRNVANARSTTTIASASSLPMVEPETGNDSYRFKNTATQIKKEKSPRKNIPS
jgi:hypothetical protein